MPTVMNYCDLNAIWISAFWLGKCFNWFHYFTVIPFLLFITIHSAGRELLVLVEMNKYRYRLNPLCD